MAEVVSIQIVLDDGTVQKSFANIERQSKKSAQKVNRSFATPVEKRFLATFGLFKAQLAGLATAFAAAFAGRAIIGAAQRQEDAINSLNASLRTAGRFSTEVSEDFQQFAADLQLVTRVGDETSLELLSLASTFARTNEEAKDLVAVAIDLSEATGITLEGAVRNLGKTFSGLTGELGESVPQLRGLTAEQLKAGEAVRLLQERFGGFAQQTVNTFSGRVEQLSNVFGDLLENLGFLITRSPSLLAVINVISQSISELSRSLSGFSEQGDFLEPIIRGLITFAQAVNQFLVVPLELGVNVVKVAFNAVLLTIQSGINGIAQVASRIVGFFSPDSELAQNLRLFSESSKAVFQDFSNAADNAGDTLGDFSVALNIDTFIERLKSGVDQAKPILEELGESTKKTVSDAANTVDAKAQQIGAAIEQGLVNTISTGIQAIGASFVNGQSAFDDFGKAVLGIFGDVLITIGTAILTAGKAITALKASLVSFFGGFAIAAGIATIALGGALKALSGTSGPSLQGGTAGAGGVGGPPLVEDVTDIDDEDIEQEQRVAVNIQGDVLDSSETGTRIAQILSDSFSAEGVQVVTA